VRRACGFFAPAISFSQAGAVEDGRTIGGEDLHGAERLKQANYRTSGLEEF
jgi:hypothetical protein